MSDQTVEDRVIKNNNQFYSIANLPREFRDGILEAQIAANKGWAPDNKGFIDERIAHCPTCQALGMNTCFGYWAFVCGADIMPDGEVSEPCGTLPLQNTPHSHIDVTGRPL